MKKFLLFVAVLFVAAGAMAQDVFVAGHNYNSSNKKEAYLYKNNSPFISTWSGTSYDLEFTALELTPAGDKLYYTRHSGQGWTDIYSISTTNPSGNGTQIYNCPSNKGLYLTDLAYDPEGDHIYGVGYRQASSGDDTRQYAVLIKDNAVMYEQDADGYESAMYGAVCHGGDVYSCGAEAWSEGDGLDNWAYLCVYKNGTRIADLHGDYKYCCAYGITAYQNKLYICGKIQDGNNWKAAVWNCYLDGTGLAELFSTESNSDDRTAFVSITEDAGSIYAYAIVPGSTSAMPIYRYNVEKNTTNKIVSNTSGSFSKQIVVNNHSYYWVSNNNYVKKGSTGETVLSDLPFTAASLAVNCTAQHTVYNLPFEDHFEMGATHWDEWLKVDYDNDNGDYPSYWDRYDYEQNLTSARHRWGCNVFQEGDLVSPAIKIPSDVNAKLRFYSKVEDYTSYPAGQNASAVYVLKAPSSSFVLTYDNYSTYSNNVTQIWSMDDHADFYADDSWHLASNIDLSAFKGKTIYLIFYYKGNCAHAWNVDDVVVTGTTDGIEEEGENVALSVMPNPANDFIRVNGLNGMEEVNIYNTLGQVVKTARLNDGESLSISDLSAGVYMLRSEKNAKVVKFTVK